MHHGQMQAHHRKPFMALLPTLRGLVTTTTDQSFQIEPSEGLLKRLQAAFDARAHSPEAVL